MVRVNYENLFYFIFVLNGNYFSYSLIHATRKTFSNVKYSLMSVWTPQNLSETEIFDNKVHCVFKLSVLIRQNYSFYFKLWNSHTLFTNQKDADYFMGVLDAIFMFSYAIVIFCSVVFVENRRRFLQLLHRAFTSVVFWAIELIQGLFCLSVCGVPRSSYVLLFLF